MLYALGTPLAFLALVVAFVVGVVVHGSVQAFVAARLGDRAPAAFGGQRLDPRRHLDPFGAVGAAIGGLGWGKPVALDPRRLRGKVRFTLALLAGPAANLVLGVAAVIGFLLLAPVGTGTALAEVAPADVVHGNALDGLPSGQLLLLVFGVTLIGVALLELVPLPPLDGGRLLFVYAPHTLGWQRAEYYLAEQNWGIGILLVLLLLPLVGREPLLLVLFNAVGGPILGLIGRLG